MNFGKLHQVLALALIGLVLAGSVQAGIDDGLVGAWTFDDCTARDSSANANHGALQSSPACVDGVKGKAYRFNGSSDHIIVPSSSSFPTSAITLSYWLNREGSALNGRWENVLSKEESFQSYAETGGACTYCFESGLWKGSGGMWSGYASPNNALTTTGWVHVAFSFDNATHTAKTYINGALVGTTTETDANAHVRTSTNSLYIGRNGSADVYYLKGLIDEVRLYNRALADTEIQQLYGNGNAVAPATSSTTPTPSKPVTSFEITGRTQHDSGSKGNYYWAGLNYSDGTGKFVSPTWTISGSGTHVEPGFFQGGNQPVGIVSIDYSAPSATVNLVATYTEDGKTYTATYPITITHVTAPPKTLVITGASTLGERETATYTATVTYADGSTRTVSPQWSSGGAASITADGILTTTTVSEQARSSVSASYTEGSFTVYASIPLTVKQSLPRPISMEVIGPTTVNEGSTATYMATVTYSDGSTKTVAPWTWQIPSGNSARLMTIASTDQGGILTTGQVDGDLSIRLLATFSDGTTQNITAEYGVTVKDVPVGTKPTETSTGLAAPAVSITRSAGGVLAQWTWSGDLATVKEIQITLENAITGAVITSRPVPKTTTSYDFIVSVSPADPYRVKVTYKSVLGSTTPDGTGSAGLTTANLSPSEPSFLATPAATINNPVQVSVRAGTDPEGGNVAVNCTATGSDHASPNSAATSGLGAGGRTVQHSFVFSAVGSQTIHCTTFDTAGNGSTTVTQSITVTASPVASFTLSSASGNAPLIVSVDASGSQSPGGSIVSYAWDDDLDHTLSGKTSAFRFTSPGTYVINLTVTDSNGRTAKANKSVVVKAAVAPVANAPFASHSVKNGVVTVKWDSLSSTQSNVVYFAPPDSAGAPDLSKVVAIPVTGGKTAVSTKTAVAEGTDGFYAVASCRSADARDCDVLSNIERLIVPKRNTKAYIWYEQSAQFFGARKEVLEARHAGLKKAEIAMTIAGDTKDWLNGMKEIGKGLTITSGAGILSGLCSAATTGLAAGDLLAKDLIIAAGKTVLQEDQQKTDAGAWEEYLSLACTAALVPECVIGSWAACFDVVYTAANNVLWGINELSYGRALIEGVLAQDFLNLYFANGESVTKVNESLGIPSSTNISDAIAAIASKHMVTEYGPMKYWFTRADTYRQAMVLDLINTNIRYVDKVFAGL